ncbi:MAG TPA: peptidoglycan DD-metalloendopeptidase family protein [Roseiflexaceae bacterium]|nr:peptidoglycan DD-metalloendopeptidase family protein [Roseiflexaceae bacterium]
MITTALRTAHTAAAGLAALAAAAMLWATLHGEAVTVLGWSNGLTAQAAPHPVAQPVAQPVTPDTSGDLTLLQHAPTISAAQIDAVLANYGSPAAGTGKDWYEAGQRYAINPAVGVAFFVHESTAGTNPYWAGWKPDRSTTHNVGNIICAGYPTCFGRFRDYPDWRTGIEDWYRLIRTEYMDGRGLTTVNQIIPIYAPSVENDVQAYIDAVNGMVAQWARNPVQPAADNAIHGAPLHGALAITQGYGVGTHAPADVWGGVDYAAQTGEPLYAIIDGTADVSQTWPCGLGLKVKGATYQTLYCHMSRVDVQTGQPVSAGQPVGAAGASGEASGPHVHLELRKDGRIIDPTHLVQETK